MGIPPSRRARVKLSLIALPGPHLHSSYQSGFSVVKCTTQPRKILTVDQTSMRLSKSKALLARLAVNVESAPLYFFVNAKE